MFAIAIHDTVIGKGERMPSSMRCFKSFFQHTWHPQQMESPSRFELTKTKTQSMDEMEFGEVKTNNVATSTPVPSGSIPCRNGGCKGWTSTAESPWHFLKTVFLISVIVALVLWVIVYAFLAQYKVL